MYKTLMIALFTLAGFATLPAVAADPDSIGGQLTSRRDER